MFLKSEFFIKTFGAGLYSKSGQIWQPACLASKKVNKLRKACAMHIVHTCFEVVTEATRESRNSSSPGSNGSWLSVCKLTVSDEGVIAWTIAVIRCWDDFLSLSLSAGSIWPSSPRSSSSSLSELLPAGSSGDEVAKNVVGVRSITCAYFFHLPNCTLSRYPSG